MRVLSHVLPVWPQGAAEAVQLQPHGAGLVQLVLGGQVLRAQHAGLGALQRPALRCLAAHNVLVGRLAHVPVQQRPDGVSQAGVKLLVEARQVLLVPAHALERDEDRSCRPEHNANVPSLGVDALAGSQLGEAASLRLHHPVHAHALRKKALVPPGALDEGLASRPEHPPHLQHARVQRVLLRAAVLHEVAKGAPKDAPRRGHALLVALVADAGGLAVGFVTVAPDPGRRDEQPAEHELRSPDAGPLPR